jgi:tetratricopeptide (TPR) repeat protein
MAQLIDPKTEQALWAESYERALENVLVLQGEVAQAIAGELAVSLTPDEASRLAEARPVDPEAYDAYLKGSYHWKELTPEDLDTAQRYFERALEKDPEYAPAYEGLAWVWLARQQFGFVPPHEAGPKAKAAALKAIELDEGSAAAHEALAVARYAIDWDWAASEAEFRRALELDPDRANTHAYFSHLLCFMGRAEEALVHAERALELDPFSSLFRGLYSNVFLALRRYDDVIEQCRNVLELSPEDPIGHGNLWESYHMKGMHDEALPEAAAFFTTLGLGELGDTLIERHAEVGYSKAMGFAADALAELSRDTPFPPYFIAFTYAGAGRKDQALDWLERGYEVRDPGMPYLIEPWWDILRPDPRFQDLLRRMNLSTTSAGPEAQETGVASGS